MKKTLVFPKGIGRLPPGISLERAQIELDRIYQSARGPREEGRILVSGFPTNLVSRAKASLLLFSGAAGCVLLIACANVANLLLAHATGRQKEISIRSALGAGRGRIARQLLTESVLLAVLGGAAGMLLAFWTNRFLHSFIATLPLADAPRLDLRVLGFSLVVALVTGLGFGLAPALTLWRVSLIACWIPARRAATVDPVVALRLE